jgi:hypothetical protein
MSAKHFTSQGLANIHPIQLATCLKDKHHIKLKHTNTITILERWDGFWMPNELPFIYLQTESLVHQLRRWSQQLSQQAWG